jgi:hypothetical protein
MLNVTRRPDCFQPDQYGNLHCSKQAFKGGVKDELAADMDEDGTYMTDTPEYNDCIDGYVAGWNTVCAQNAALATQNSCALDAERNP